MDGRWTVVWRLEIEFGMVLLSLPRRSLDTIFLDSHRFQFSEYGILLSLIHSLSLRVGTRSALARP